MTRTQDISSQNTLALLSHQTPFHVHMVHLTVKNLTLVSQFYQDIMGLTVVSQSTNEILLGTSEIGFLHLKADPSARQQSRGMAGLFHTAFLVPARRDLANWLKHAQANTAAIEGASDHGVSEAFYLSDPEGNGIEIYVDRPQKEWIWQDGKVTMGNARIDMRGLLHLASQSNNDATPFVLATGSRIGHVHLCVPTLAEARGFLQAVLGLDETCAFTGAAFFSNGGYHHHIATNIWSSEGGEKWQAGYLGLSKVTFAASNPNARLALVSKWKSNGAQDHGAETCLTSPWGTVFALQ